jgi:nicotinamidase-related amidase
MGDRLLPLPLTERSVHLCIDMQRIFSAEGPWPTPWMDRVLPVADALASLHPERTVFTRFVPPERPDEMPACGSATTHAGASPPANTWIFGFWG